MATREGTLKVEILEHGRPAAARVHLLASDAGYRCPAGCGPYEKDRHFTTAGSFVLSLPAGKTHIMIEKGKEYKQITDSFEMRDGELIARKYDLNRWIDMASLGWYSGDTHVHRPLGDMRHLMEAEDLHAAPVITVWNERDHWQSRPLGKRRVVSTGGRAYGILSQEDERGGGAIMGFDLIRPVKMKATRWYPPQVAYGRRWRRQGAVVEQEKPFWLEAPVNVALGVVDAIGVVNNHLQRAEVMENEAWGRPRDKGRYPGKQGFVYNVLDLYYRYLNLGIKIPISAGSASGVLRNPLGYNRLYVRLEEGFSYKGWFEGMKGGRAFATNGPMLFLQIDGKTPSLTETLAKPSSVEIGIRALSSARLSFVDLVRNGRVYRRFDCGRRSEFAAKLRLKLGTSCWIAARAFEENEVTVRFAHSNPVFVEVGGPIIPSRRDALYYMEWCEELLEALRDDPGKFRSEGQRERVGRLYKRAISFYGKLARGAGGGLTNLK